MCRPMSEGGLRCAAHTRPAYQAATFGTPEWDEAARTYAATREGAARLHEEALEAHGRGDHERHAALGSALMRGASTREASAEAYRRAYLGPASGFPTESPPIAESDREANHLTYLPDETGTESAFAFTASNIGAARDNAVIAGRGTIHVSRPVSGAVDLLHGDYGSVIAEPNPHRPLRCTCPGYRRDYTCEHVRQTLAAIQSRVLQEDVTDPHVALAAAEREQFANDPGAEPEPEVGAEAPEPAAGSYTDDPAAFQADYRAARARVRAGQPAIQYMTENATGGLGAPDGGRGFGVELEFVGGDLQGIARDLHAAGLTRTPRQVNYHSDHSVYRQHQGGWKFERDCTVSGEVISPVMHDTPETWENLQKVCDIIERHGGRASVRAGSHIHISAGDYRSSGADHARLLNLFSDNEDLMYRLSSNPERGTHRRLAGNSWSTPNTAPSTGFRSIAAARQTAGHGNAVNFQHCAGRSSDHVEYRMWDSTLDPATIQAQIKVSLALTEAAHRDTGYTATGHTPVGSRRRHNRETYGEQRRLTGEAWHSDTASFRGLVDRLFTRPEDKAQITGLFAATRWQWRSRTRGRARATAAV